MSESKNTKWVRLGDYIEVFDKRNTDGKPLLFYGINKDKTFMPTVADTNELDNSKYKVVDKGVFVFSGMQTGRDVCIRIALFDEENPVIISPAYTTFKIKDTTELLPEFLFLQFNREESDRYGWFLSDGSIRSNLDWERFCDIEIPLPDIEVQRELVATYNGLKALAEQNEALLPRLSAACHAYIVDCRAKYPSVPLGEYIEQCDERAGDNFTVDNVIGISNVKSLIPTKADMKDVSLAPYKLFKPNEFCYVTVTSRNGGKISLAMNNTAKTYIVSSSYLVFCCKDENILLPEYLFLLLNRTEFDRYTRFNSWGSARETFDWSEMCRVEIPVPPIEIQKAIVEVFSCSERAKQIASKARARMKNLCPALVQRAANS